MADVAILIVNWNTRSRLQRCLASLASLPDTVSRRTVVVDNGSSDGSAAMVASDFPGALLLRNDRNEGFARAVNRGIAETDSPFILLLNSDAELQPGALDALARHLRDHADVAAAGAQLHKPDGSRQHAFDVFPSLTTELVNKGVLRRIHPGRYPSRLQHREDPFDVDSLIGACMMLRRETIDTVGMLDERFFVFYEETDWCLRARRDGWRIVLVPRARAMHAQGETKAHHPGRARVEYWRSKYAYFDKHRGRGPRLFLQAASWVRLTAQVLLGAIACLVTLGQAARLRRRLAADAWLWGWHAAGTPAGMGFAPGGAVPGFVRVRAPDGTRWLPAESALSIRGTPLFRIREFLDTEASRPVKEGRTKRHYRVTLAEDGDHREWVVKLYKPGGPGSRLKALWRGSRADRELGRMATAARRGIPVPLPRMVADWPDGSSALVFEPLSGWQTLDAWLRGIDAPAGEIPWPVAAGRARHRALGDAGRFARRVYEAGVDQDDFNPTNVFVRPRPDGGLQFRLVDFERVRIRPVVPGFRRVWTLAKMARERAWASMPDRIRFLRGLAPATRDRGRLRGMLAELEAALKRVRERDRVRNGRNG